MKITGFETYKVPPRWTFLKLTTDTDLVGWGEGIVDGRAETVCAAIEGLSEEFLLGRGPNQVSKHWQRIYRGTHHRGGPILMSALAAIDQALWDLKGKDTGRPVYELLGGPVRERIRVCPWITGETPEDLARAAEEKRDLGYPALAMMMNLRPARLRSTARLERVRERLQHVQEAVGNDVDVGVDFRGRVSRAVAKQLFKVVDEYDPLYIEEPLLPEYDDDLPELVQYTSSPVATGQRKYSRWDFKSLMENGSVDIVQPAVCNAGGISEMQRIISLAETFDVAVVPKCPGGPIAFAASIQLGLGMQNIVMQDQHHDLQEDGSSDFYAYLSNKDFFSYTNGYFEIDDTPGLGIRVDEDAVVTRALEEIHWQPPAWHHDDGSIADW